MPFLAIPYDPKVAGALRGDRLSARRRSGSPAASRHAAASAADLADEAWRRRDELARAAARRPRRAARARGTELRRAGTRDRGVADREPRTANPKRSGSMPNEKGIATDYRSTLNLPRTDFPMKADLAAREPLRVAWWREQRVYERRLERNAHNAPWILHDGPPYANNEVHVGTLAQPRPQGRVLQSPSAAGTVRAVRPRLGHARPADRTRRALAVGDRLSQDRPDRVAGEVPRVRAVLAGRPARHVPADGVTRRVRPSVHDDPERVRGDDRRHAGRAGRRRPNVQGAALDAVVHQRRDGARRCRDRIPGARLAVDLRALPCDPGPASRNCSTV